jgi:FkbM family methyltransferase
MVSLVRPIKKVGCTLLPLDSFRGQFVRRVARRASYDPVWMVLERFGRAHRDVVFVQIGSHNGEAGDPLARFLDRSPAWRGVMVEPIPEHFAALTRRRGLNERFQLVRAAITDHDGSVEMTTVEVLPGMHPSAGQLSSLHLDVILKHELAIPELKENLKTVSVPAMTFDSLTRGLDRIDLIHTDTEGHDAAILDQIDLERWAPKVVMFEHKHLGITDNRRTRERLAARGYRLVSNESDTIAVRDT